LATIKNFPNNVDEYQYAQDAMKWMYSRTQGVYGANGNLSVTALATPNMSINVSDGLGWLRDHLGNGCVFWNDTYYSNSALLNLTIDAADGVQNRVDRVVVSWETANYTQKPEIKILKGTFSVSDATPPAITNNSVKREISLAKIAVAAGTTAITSAMITDERLDSTVCGLVTEDISVDTTTMQAQFETLLTAVEQELNQINSNTVYELKRLQFTNTEVATTAFLADETYEDFPYRASVALTGVLATMTPDVILSVPDAMSGNYAPAAGCYAGGVYIYAAAIPDAAITIPTIICWKGVS
jgi:hypothetical protein